MNPVSPSWGGAVRRGQSDSQGGHHVREEAADAAEEVQRLPAELLAERRRYERDEPEAEREHGQAEGRLDLRRVEVALHRREAERKRARGRSYRRNEVSVWLPARRAKKMKISLAIFCRFVSAILTPQDHLKLSQPRIGFPPSKQPYYRRSKISSLTTLREG